MTLPIDALLVASPGGHIDELHELAPRMAGVSQQRIWVTASTTQTRTLLDGEQVEWVPNVGARQGLRAVRSLGVAWSVLRRHRPDVLISTGAALCLPYIVAARIRGVRVHYIDSATRLHGPSLTGRLMEIVPGVRLHHQGFVASRRRWSRAGSVFDGFDVRLSGARRPVRRAVVMMGTERFPFTRAIKSVAAALPRDCEVLWQVGHTPTTDLPGVVRAWVPNGQLGDAVREADLIVTHAGVGSVMMALRAGHHPLIIPRLAGHGEHVDDHQLDLSAYLEARGLATVAGPTADLAALLSRCAIRETVRVPGPTLRLQGTLLPRP